MDLRAYLPRIFACCVAASFLKWVLITAYSRWVPDYTVFWAAAKMVQMNPSLVYNDTALTLYQSWFFEMFNGWRPWAYPPSALVLLIPFTKLPVYPSFFAFAGLTLAAYLYAVRRMVGWNWALALVAISSPLFFAARSGQMTMLIGALVIGGLLLLPRKEILGGVLLGVAASLKPQLLLLAPLALVASRRWDGMAGAYVGLMALPLASIPLGAKLWADWLGSLPAFLETVTALNLWRGGVTPSSIMWNLGLGGWPQVVIQAVFLIVAALAVWNVFRRSDDPALQLVAIIGGALLCAPYAMNYELALLAPAAAMWLLNRETPLWLMTASGLLLFADSIFTPPVAMAFILLALKDHLLPFRNGPVEAPLRT
jgi:hypothetical protein